MKRYLVYSALFTIYAVVGCSCASLPAKPSVEQIRPPNEEQADIIMRDVAWLNDRIPILRFEPLFPYGYLRLQIESCAGMRREGWPRFYIAPIRPIYVKGQPRAAIYVPQANAIIFATGAEGTLGIVAHELLHYTIWPIIPPKPDGETDAEEELRYHPVEFFGRDSVPGKCTSVLTQQG